MHPSHYRCVAMARTGLISDIFFFITIQSNRWQRAESFGLDPPREVVDLLDNIGPKSPLQNNIWFNRI